MKIVYILFILSFSEEANNTASIRAHIQNEIERRTEKEKGRKEGR